MDRKEDQKQMYIIVKEKYYLYDGSILSEGVMHILYAEKRNSGEIKEPFVTWLSNFQQLS